MATPDYNNEAPHLELRNPTSPIARYRHNVIKDGRVGLCDLQNPLCAQRLADGFPQST